MKSGRRCFTKIRKWAEEVGAQVEDSKYFDTIYITLPNGKKFTANQQFESTSKQVISRGRGLKYEGKPAGFYFGSDYTFESTQKEAIEEMKQAL